MATNYVEQVLDPGGLGSSISTGLGKMFGLDNNAQIDKAQASLDDIMSYAQDVSRQNRGIYGNYLDEMKGLYGTGADKYQTALDNFTNAIGEAPANFEYTGKVEDFFDKFANQEQQAAMNAIEQAASSGGTRFSSNYLDKLAQKQRALSTEAWRTAYDTMMRDRSQQLAEWQAGQGAKQSYLANLGKVTDIYGQDRTNLGNAVGDYYSNMANQNNADLETYADVTQNKANLDTQRKSGMGGLLGAIGSVIGSIF